MGELGGPVKGLRATHTAPDDLTRPASEADVQRAYLDATSMGYALAGVGAVTALIGTTLALSESEEGLHAVGLALGLLAAGLITDRLDRSIGTARVHVGALVLLALAVLALVSRFTVHWRLADRLGEDLIGGLDPRERA
jgi:hypothetical protein